MQRALAFDRSPPLSVAFRFFLNVPIFLLLAALLLIWQALSGNPYIRWSPYVLATTHFLTLGVLASAMLGAMMQILPVAAHIQVLLPRVTSRLVHAGLSLGTISLAAGFLTANPALHAAAVVLLAGAFLVFLLAVGGGLLRDSKRRSPGSGEILVAVRFALLSLGAVLVLGLFMAGLRAGLWTAGNAAPGNWLQALPDLHVLWGLAGWVGLLVIGVSYQVIPIFQATEIYPRPVTQALAPSVFILLGIQTAVLATAAATDTVSILRSLPAGLLAIAYLIYGGVTAHLLWTRKRPSPEPTTWFWHTAMAALILSSLTGAAYPWLTGPEPGSSSAVQMLLGTLFITGFAVSAVNGMLYKIVPFLLWHNAQRKAPVALPFMPKVKNFISERDAMRQYTAHLLAVVLLAISCLVPALLLPGALALGASAILLAWNIVRALRLYIVTCTRIEAAAVR